MKTRLCSKTNVQDMKCRDGTYTLFAGREVFSDYFMASDFYVLYIRLYFLSLEFIRRPFSIQLQMWIPIKTSSIVCSIIYKYAKKLLLKSVNKTIDRFSIHFLLLFFNVIILQVSLLVRRKGIFILEINLLFDCY